MMQIYKESIACLEKSLGLERQVILVPGDCAKNNIPYPAAQPCHAPKDPVKKSGRVPDKTRIAILCLIMTLYGRGDLPRETHDVLDASGKGLPHLFQVTFLRESGGAESSGQEKNQE